MKWTEWHRKILWRLKDGGLSINACTFAVSMIFGKRFHWSEVEDIWAGMDPVIWKRKMDVERSWKHERGAASMRADNIVSCLLHHADLLRAGHTPERTEFRIEEDGAPQILATSRATQSYCGSPSATCAEHA